MFRAFTPDGREISIYGRRLLDTIAEVDPLSVIDLGVGQGLASALFLYHGHTVKGISLSDAPACVRDHGNYTHIKQNMFDVNVEPADILWASHVMEHMTNVGAFLDLCKTMLKPEGLLGIVVPNDNTLTMVDGHLTFWTPAHLIYNLVINGWNCKEAKYYNELRDIALMVVRKEIDLPKLNYDRGDLEALSPYFPVPIIHRETNPWLDDNF